MYKKKTNGLSLKRETLKALTDLRRVAAAGMTGGGEQTNTCISIDYTACPISECDQCTITPAVSRAAPKLCAGTIVAG